ncbi:Alpha/Beta hydrolase protein [Stachybotrys elegans]|uniref:Alpha/Beta hydrolase protein n=1 Tax=Stachybotrys elegans TaxID=80388 RepID=A0A8K0WLA5_9HYPO|nr:Alpha/Beta hydrolase protein [Stachybotrys elegans]
MLIVCGFAHDSQIPLSFGMKPSLDWKDCGTVDGRTLQCSQLDVPMDHFHTSVDNIFTLPLIRLVGNNASSTGDRHILFNPGGPGGSGVGLIRGRGSQLNKIIGEEFHLLGFDPRGVVGSIPQANCYPSNTKRVEAFLTNPWDVYYEAGEMYTRAENKVKACGEIMGERGHYINTPQTAADMNSILDALGQEKMYYWGFSYGTALGQTYAQMFPGRVSRLIIDGVLNLDEWYNNFMIREYLTDIDRIFAGFLDECLKAGVACPLKSIGGRRFESSSELRDYLEDFLSQLEEEPIPVYINNATYGAVTRHNLVTNGIFFGLYSPSLWPSLAHNLAELLKGNSTPVFTEYSKSWALDVLSDDSNTFIILNDNRKTGPGAPIRGIKAVQNFTLSRPEMSYLMSRYEGSEIYDRASWSIPTTHDFHPRYYPNFPPTRTAEPILVLSTSWDPVCPLTSAKKARDSFEGAGFVEQKSYGHCTMSMPSLCTAKHVKRYFNEGKLPEDGSTCSIDADYFQAENRPSTLSEEDEELLANLHVLASRGVVTPPFRFTGI